MFGNLRDLSYERNIMEAAGFYITYLLLIVILTSTVFLLTGMAVDASSRGLQMKTGILFASLACTYISIRILSRKNLKGEKRYWIMVVAAGLLGLIGGSLLGLIPPTYLTTRKHRGSE